MFCMPIGLLVSKDKTEQGNIVKSQRRQLPVNLVLSLSHHAGYPVLLATRSTKLHISIFLACAQYSPDT